MWSPSPVSLSPLIKCHLLQTKPPLLTIKVKLLGNSRITINNLNCLIRVWQREMEMHQAFCVLNFGFYRLSFVLLSSLAIHCSDR